MLSYLPIDACLLVRCLHYDALTGIFRWRISPSNRSPAGSIAGTQNHDGYIHIRFNGMVCKAHRLAWAYAYGYVPPIEVDHYDGDPGNNRLRNLRLCIGTRGDHMLNMQNIREPYSTNTTGILGVTRHVCGKFTARIVLNYEKIYLGIYATPEEAGEVYLATKRLIHEFNTV